MAGSSSHLTAVGAAAVGLSSNSLANPAGATSSPLPAAAAAAVSDVKATAADAAGNAAAWVAEFTSKISPSWPAETAALSGISQLAGPASGSGTSMASNAPELKQLTRAGYALACLVVAVVAAQMGAATKASGKLVSEGSFSKYWWLHAFPHHHT
jgi:hypothetical protein